MRTIDQLQAHVLVAPRRARRAAVAAAAVVTVAAVLVTLAAPAAVAAPARTSATVTVVRITVVNGRPQGGIKRPTVKKGTTVRFVVASNKGEELHLHGYDVEKTMRPPKPTVIQVVAKIPGRFELEMHHPDVLLAQLTVRP